MEQLQTLINRLDIREEYKSLLYDLVLAETFNARRSHDIIFFVEKYQNPADKRVWVIIKLLIETPIEELPMFPLRPFTDKSCAFNHTKGGIEFQKTYYLYEE
jgi:hypothetical protein